MTEQHTTYSDNVTIVNKINKDNIVIEHYTSYKINKNITIVKRVDYFSNYYGVGVFDKKNNSTTFTCATENEANYRYNKLLDDYSNMSA
jgi:hypothetical protein